jgi:uncharacterized coiled-coil DUF342 family protein
MSAHRLENGSIASADQKVAELLALLAEARADRDSETRWAHQYKTERDAANAKIAKMIHPGELRYHVDAIRRKQDYWRNGPAALDALLSLVLPAHDT